MRAQLKQGIKVRVNLNKLSSSHNRDHHGQLQDTSKVPLSIYGVFVYEDEWWFRLRLLQYSAPKDSTPPPPPKKAEPQKSYK